MIFPYFSHCFVSLYAYHTKKVKKYICAIPFNKRKKCSYFQGQTGNEYLSKY